MPNRLICESICTSDTIDQLSWQEEAFFYRLLTQCDDYGRFDARPAIIKGRMFPLKRITIEEIEKCLNRLSVVGLVEIYHVDDRPILQVMTWGDYQRIRAKKSKYPPKPKSYDFDGENEELHNPLSFDVKCCQMPSNVDVIQSNPIQSESNPNQNPIPEIELSNVPFDDFWKLYPKHTKARYAEQAFNAAMLKEEPAVIIAALQDVIEKRWSRFTEQEKDYIPDAVNWLKGECWKDEVEPYRPKNNRRKEDKLPNYYNANPVRNEGKQTLSAEELAKAQAILSSRGSGKKEKG